MNDKCQIWLSSEMETIIFNVFLFFLNDFFALGLCWLTDANKTIISWVHEFWAEERRRKENTKQIIGFPFSEFYQNPYSYEFRSTSKYVIPLWPLVASSLFSLSSVQRLGSVSVVWIVGGKRSMVYSFLYYYLFVFPFTMDVKDIPISVKAHTPGLTTYT